MEAFGYLDPGPADSAALYTEDAITAALTRVQKFGAIPQTGRLDDETKKVNYIVRLFMTYLAIYKC